MSVLVRKEIRMLAPAWLVAVAVATLPVWLNWDDLLIPFISFCLAVLFLALAPFGQEIGCGTLGQLLSQPEKRLRFWTVKVGLVAVALASVWAVLAICGWIFVHQVSQFEASNLNGFPTVLRLSGMMTLMAFAGGLWTTLLFRNVATAFWTSIAVPGLIWSAVVILLRDQMEDEGLMEGVLALALLLYVLGGFWFGRKLFLGAQDVPWRGAELAVPQVPGLRLLSFGAGRICRPWVALLRKELQLQAGTLSLVPWLVMFHLGTLVLRHYTAPSSTTTQLLGLAPSIWLVVPVVFGCVTVAEERRLNTLEGQLCLPVRKRTQFAVKFALTLGLGIIFGAVVPWLLESFAKPEYASAPLSSFVLMAGVLAGAAFFASTLSCGMLQAASAFLCLPVVVGIGMSAMVNFVFGWLWLLKLPVFPWLVVALVLVWRAYRNYRCPQIGRTVWLANLIVTAALLASACLVPAAIHQRPWEFLMSLEPIHGAARLKAGRLGEVGQTSSNVYVLLPDGRLWGGRLVHLSDSYKLNSLGFLRGSDWAGLAVSPGRGATALKSEGTLWSVSDNPDNLNLAEIGADADWKEVVAGDRYFLALKQNGTLWGWGYDSYGVLDSSRRAREFPTPIQIGMDSDWADLYVPGHGKVMAIKRDGRLLRWDTVLDHVSSRLITRVNSKLTTLTGTNWTSLTSDFTFTLGVRPDGTLWAEGFVPPRLLRADGPSATPVEIGTNSSWISVSFGMAGFLALKADGTLLIMDHGGSQSEFSKYADWIVASSDYQGIWALAKDGTLCGWLAYLERPDLENYEVLRPTRLPIVINILGGK